MYTRYYGLKEKPFNITPDSHFLYLGKLHGDALGHLLYGIRERKGFILITGEVGTGKTTLCRALIREIENEAEVGFILNTFLSSRELLKAINEDLVGRSSGKTRKELVDGLNRFLLEKHAADRNVVLIIDECQNLSHDVLEQIRMLSNLETEKHKLLQIVMVGQPEISEMLGHARLRQLAQRISVSYHLQPLDYEDTVHYIRYRLKVADGGSENGDTGVSRRGGVRFSRAALRRVFAYSGGVPRKINIVCDRALLIGFVRGKRSITDGIVRRAVEELVRGASRARRPAWRATQVRALKAAAAVFGVAAAVALLAGYHGLGGWEGLRGKAAGDEEQPSAETTAPPGLPAGSYGVRTGPSQPGAREESRQPSPDKPAPRVSAEAEAVACLARIWGRPAGEGIELQGEERDIPALAGRYGMGAVSCWADGDFLRRVNIPCMIRVRGGPGSARIPVVLESVTEDGAFVIYGDERERRVENGELGSRMSGRVTYFYPEGAIRNALIVPGTYGHAVADLQDGLREIGFAPGDRRGWYGSETVEAVKRFQESQGLPRDGIAGINEIILIRSLRAGDRVPRLGARVSEG